MKRPYPDGRPPSIRDFMAFEEHIVNARRNRGREVPPAWHEIPVFYFTNPGAGLTAGEVIGSGTVGRGCVLERGDGRWLTPGDEIELEIEGIGVLRNRIV